MNDEAASEGVCCGSPFRCPRPDETSRLRIDDDTTMEFPWGPYWVFGTASYWVSQYRSRFGQAPIAGQALGRNLLEETAACLLGGYGIPAEVGLAAFRRVRDAGLLREGAVVHNDRFLRCLEAPLRLGPAGAVRSGGGTGRLARYRFARQRAERLAAATRHFVTAGAPPAADPLELRRWLLGIPGVGPKTASWIIRNQTGSDAVAIVDIHLRRAGVAAGFFAAAWDISRDYARFEKAFLGFARLGGVPASGLDALIWDEQRLVRSRAHLGTGLPAGERDWSWAVVPPGGGRRPTDPDPES